MTSRIVHAKGEHPFESIDAASAILLVSVHDRFGVGRGPKLMPACHQLSAEIMVVVDLTVEHNPNGPIFIAPWLGPAGAIDDREPPVAERGACAVCNALSIWT